MNFKRMEFKKGEAVLIITRDYKIKICEKIQGCHVGAIYHKCVTTEHLCGK